MREDQANRANRTFLNEINRLGRFFLLFAVLFDQSNRKVHMVMTDRHWLKKHPRACTAEAIRRLNGTGQIDDPWWMIGLDNMSDAFRKGEFPMPSYAVTVQLPRDHDPIQTLTVLALDEEDARTRVRRILSELGWVLGTDKNIIDVRVKDS